MEKEDNENNDEKLSAMRKYDNSNSLFRMNYSKSPEIEELSYKVR